MLVALPDDDIVLRLRFFQLTIIVCLELHQRSKDVLILVSILIPQQHLPVVPKHMSTLTAWCNLKGKQGSRGFNTLPLTAPVLI